MYVCVCVFPPFLSVSTEELAAISARFDDLSTGESVITRDTFLEALPLPGRFGMRLFDCLDTDGDKTIDKLEFITGVRLLLKSDEHEKLRVLFDMFRCGKDVVTREDMGSMFRSAALASLRIIHAYERGSSVAETAWAPTPTEPGEVRVVELPCYNALARSCLTMGCS